MWRPSLRGAVAKATKGKAPPFFKGPRSHEPFFRTTAEKARLQAQERDRTPSGVLATLPVFFMPLRHSHTLLSTHGRSSELTAAMSVPPLMSPMQCSVMSRGLAPVSDRVRRNAKIAFIHPPLLARSPRSLLR